MRVLQIDVYGKPERQCFACGGVKRWFTNRGVPFNFIDVTEDRDALEFVVGLGFTATPVIVCGDVNFQGYNTEKLELVAGMVEAAA